MLRRDTRDRSHCIRLRAMGRRMARLYVSEAGFRHPNVKERLGRAVPATAERSAGNKRSQLSLGLRSPECERFFLLPLDPATNEL
jgi:hypothetical protein